MQIGAAGPLCQLGRSQAIIYSRLVGDSGKVFAFEAIPENMDVFRAYITRKHIKNIVPTNIGLWKEKGVIAFNAAEQGNVSTASGIMEARDNQRKFYTTERELPVDTLDNLLAGFGVTQLDLVNVTTNGGEAEILSGAMGALEKYKPVVCMPTADETDEFFDNTLVPMGYKKQRDHVKLHVLGKPLDILWGAVEP